MRAQVDPEPSEDEREAIVAALRDSAAAEDGWSAAALLEGVEDGALEP